MASLDKDMGLLPQAKLILLSTAHHFINFSRHLIRIPGLWIAAAIVGFFLLFSLSFPLVTHLLGFRYRNISKNLLEILILRRRTRRQKPFSWKSVIRNGRPVLSSVLDQCMQPICWAYAIKVHLESKLRMGKWVNVEVPISEILDTCRVPGGPQFFGLPLKTALELLTNGMWCILNKETVCFRVCEVVSSTSESEMVKVLYEGTFLATIIPTEAFHDPSRKGEVYHVTKSEYERFIKQKKAYHAVVIVGIADVDGVPVWVAQNSWGNGYRDDGFFYLVRESGIIEDEVNPIFNMVFVNDFEVFGAT